MGKRKITAVVMLLAFMMSALLPFFAVYDTAALESQNTESLFGDKILLCTADGFKWVDLEDIQNGEEHPEPHPDFQCALCVVAAHGLKSVTQVADIVVTYAPFEAPLDYITSFRIARIEQYVTSGISSRAPPSSVIV